MMGTLFQFTLEGKHHGPTLPLARILEKVAASSAATPKKETERKVNQTKTAPATYLGETRIPNKHTQSSGKQLTHLADFSKSALFISP